MLKLALSTCALALSSALPAQNEPDPREQDLTALTELVEAQYSYVDHRRETSALDLAALEAESLEIYRAQPDDRGFLRALQRYAAGLCDGHAGASVPGVSIAPARRWPVSLIHCAEGIMVDGVTADALAAGCLRGDLLLAIDGRDIEDALLDAQRFIVASTDGARRFWAIIRLSSTDAEEVNLRLQRPGDESFEVTLRCVDKSTIVPWPSYPAQRRFWCKLDEEIGYFNTSSFRWPADSNWFEARPEERDAILESSYGEIDRVFEDLAGVGKLIIDLRGNLGGTDSLGQAAAAHLLQPPYEYFGLSSKIDGAWTEPYYYEPEPAVRMPTFRGKLVLLIDEMTFSTASNFAACVAAEHHDVVVVGRPDGAGTGAPRAIELPNTKATVTFCTQRVYRAGGELIEGIGTAVDIGVMPTRAQRLTGEDAELAAALRALR